MHQNFPHDAQECICGLGTVLLLLVVLVLLLGDSGVFIAMLSVNVSINLGTPPALYTYTLKAEKKIPLLFHEERRGLAPGRPDRQSLSQERRRLRSILVRSFETHACRIEVGLPGGVDLY